VDECKPLVQGPLPAGAIHARHGHIGRAVQVDPIKFILKAPETERSKPEYDKLLSSFAFRIKLRC